MEAMAFFQHSFMWRNDCTIVEHKILAGLMNEGRCNKWRVIVTSLSPLSGFSSCYLWKMSVAVMHLSHFGTWLDWYNLLFSSVCRSSSGNCIPAWKCWPLALILKLPCILISLPSSPGPCPAVPMTWRKRWGWEGDRIRRNKRSS